ncbi:MAG: NAD(P)-dependent oxidoreductase [Holophagales bacterium]|nr:MAG: NAD(P)-dependent oxidoreductase [Holophagales bacterium]
MRIAWLGTGLMGRPMAERMLAAGHEVTVWNRTRAKTAPLAALGARVADEASDAIASAETVFTMLRDGATTEAALLDGDADLAGRAVVQMGTIASVESRELASAVAARGGEYLEAPVLGSIPQATAGTLIVFCGGAAELHARLQPVLAAIGPQPRRVGEVGDASTLKLALNQIIATQAAAFCLSLGIVRRAGLDLDAFLEILRGSLFYSKSFDARLARYLARDYANPSFPLELLVKDLDLARGEADRLGLATAAIDGVRELAARAAGAGFGEVDYGAIYEAVDPRTPERP